ncbi:hypothetical protein GH714_012803 [Hevea brasiliensis]|uniref:Eukaryotic translation initiation factor 2 subunit beta n=1 Tax=Hevea brasiliensis TaxID=3981 RepID=A0A6A6KSJ1_HEVBR|nr:hypothetical protein GH714_012803 [Hevea brasiliensis]
MDDSVDKLAEKTESLSVSDGLESTFTGLKKKKKKPIMQERMKKEKELSYNSSFIHGKGLTVIMNTKSFLVGSSIFCVRTIQKLAGDRRRTVMRPPQVLREGTKKTVFVNFMDLCKTMHRQPDHVMAFLLAELGTSGSLDGQQRLVVKGRFAPKNFEGILRRYINEYVICLGCKSPDTILSKENRLFFLRCEKCGSGRSVAPIKLVLLLVLAAETQGHEHFKADFSCLC